ncbi:carboxymethylenebutenolidase [Collimonas sp. OK607]|nr:carboxymethylenebutenolidase [Collimonas sp. OK607]
MSCEILQEQVAIPVPEDGSIIDAYVARPEQPGKYPAVIVGMELYGVNAEIRDAARRVAELGYVAIAPNFYHRTLPNDSLPFGAEGRDRGFEHLHHLSRPTVIADVRAVINFIHARQDVSERTGFLGFSMGGHIAYLAATQFDIAACACFYGGWLVNTDIELSRPEPTASLTAGIAKHGGRLIYFVGELDHAVTREQREQLAAALEDAHVRHEMVVYPDTGHSFFGETRDTFHRVSRDDAWKRVQALFAEELYQDRHFSEKRS